MGPSHRLRRKTTSIRYGNNGWDRRGGGPTASGNLGGDRHIRPPHRPGVNLQIVCARGPHLLPLGAPIHLAVGRSYANSPPQPQGSEARVTRPSRAGIARHQRNPKKSGKTPIENTAGLTFPPGDPRAVATAKGSCPQAARGNGRGPPSVFRFPRGWGGAFSGPSSLGTTILRSEESLECRGAQPLHRSSYLHPNLHATL